METHIFHTVNNGFYFLFGDTGVFFDGIHYGKKVGFSDTPEVVIDKCQNLTGEFANLKALFFTHTHSDHFNADIEEELVKIHCLLFYAPKYDNTNVECKFIDVEVSEINMDEIQIYAVKTIHDGNEELRSQPHVSFVINCPNESYFIMGDACFTDNEHEKFKKLINHRLKAIFANPYQILSHRSFNMIRALEPENVILAHKPLDEDDIGNIRLLFKAALKRADKISGSMFIPPHNTRIA